MPETRARISTSREPSAWPTASMAIGTFLDSTRTTVTGMGGGAPPAALALASPPLPQAARRTAETAMAAATAAEWRRRLMGTLAVRDGRAGDLGRSPPHAGGDVRYYTYLPECMFRSGGAMRRTKEDAAKPREAIVTAALACFERHGIGQATLSQIATEAGV